MKRKVYVIVMIEGDLEEHGFAVEPLGVFSSEKKAIKYAKELQDLTPKNGAEVVYDVFDFGLDDEPFMLAFMKKQKEISDDLAQEMIIDLMKEGMVDQLIGEDGRFYYTLTKLGQKMFNEMKTGVPENVKKFLRKRQNDD